MRLIDADALMEWAVNIGCEGKWGISLDDLTDAIEDAPTIFAVGDISFKTSAKPEWISVEDDTPFYGEPVLAVMYVPITVLGARIVGRSIGIAVCEYDGEAERERWFCGEKEVEVTHWMPQPPFPEE